jgi:hypothetical protein
MQRREIRQPRDIADILNFSHPSRIRLEREQQHSIFSACSTFVYSHGWRRVAQIVER